MKSISSFHISTDANALSQLPVVFLNFYGLSKLKHRGSTKGVGNTMFRVIVLLVNKECAKCECAEREDVQMHANNERTHTIRLTTGS